MFLIWSNGFRNGCCELGDGSVTGVRSFATIKTFSKHFAAGKLALLVKRVRQVSDVGAKLGGTLRLSRKSAAIGVSAKIIMGAKVPEGHDHRDGVLDGLPYMLPKVVS